MTTYRSRGALRTRAARTPTQAELPAMTSSLVQDAVSRDPRALRQMVDALTPVIRARALRVLRRRGLGRRQDLEDEVLDLTQQVFVALLTGDGRLLRSWDPARGLSLQNFVGLVAEQVAAAALRGRGGGRRRDEPVPPEDLEGSGADSSRSPERLVASQEMITAVFAAARARLSGQGLALFEWLFVEGRTVDEVCADARMSADAVYAWRSRLGRLVQSIAVELLEEGRG